MRAVALMLLWALTATVVALKPVKTKQLKLWSAKRVQEENKPNSPSECYFALFSGGAACATDSIGGVYKARKGWYTAEHGGSFGGIAGACGAVVDNWTPVTREQLAFVSA